jgi:hypothetical protein
LFFRSLALFDRSLDQCCILADRPTPWGQKSVGLRAAEALRKFCENFIMHIFANGYNYSEELPAGYAGVP